MRLERLDLAAYGAFADTSIAFRPGARIHVVIGANETGKSTRRAAITDFLFGFGHLSDFAFRHGNPQLRVGGCVTAFGERVDVIRRKARKAALTTLDGEPFDEGRAATWTAGFDRESYERSFSLSHDELKRGADHFLEDNGSAASALFGAAMGGLDVRAIIAELTAKADELFREKGKNPTLNAKLARYRDAVDVRQHATVTPQKWAELSRNVDQLDSEIGALQERIIAADASRVKLDALRASIDKLDAYTRVRAELAETADRVLPTQRVFEELRGLGETIRERHARLAAARALIETVQREIAEHAPDARIVSELEAVAALVDPAAQVRKGLADLDGNRLLANRDEAARRFDEALRGSWPGAARDEIRQRRATIADAIPRVRSVQRRHHALVRDVADATAALQALDDEIAELARRFAELDADTDVSLDGVDAEAERIDRDFAARQQAFDAACARLNTELLALGVTLADPLDVRSLHLPLRATVDEFCRNTDVLIEHEKRHREKRDAARASVAQREESLLRGTRAAALDRDALAGLRRERERAFDAATTAPPVAQDAAIAAYRRLAAQADAAADERFDHAAEAGARDREQRELARESSVLAAAERALADIATARRALAGRWEDAVSRVAEPGRTPHEMRELCGALEDLRERAHALATERVGLAALAAERERLLARLRTRVGSDAGFDELVREVRLRRERVRDRQAEAREVERHLQARNAARHEMVRRAEQTRAALELWAQEWRAATHAFSMDGLAPERAEDALSAAGDLLAALKTYDDNDERIIGILADRDAFVMRLEAVVGRCLPERLADVREHPFDVFDVIRMLAETARRSLEGNAARAIELERTRERAERTAEDLAKDETRYAAILDAHGLAAHEVEFSQARRRRRDELEQLLENLTAEIRAGTRRDPLDAVRELAALNGCEGLQFAIAELETTIAARRAEHDALQARRGVALHALDEIRNSEAAAAANADVAALGAEINRLARRYASYTAARIILVEEMERYTQAHQDPVVAEASRYFAALTLGRYRRILLSGNAGEDATLDVLDDDGTEKSVTALSEGTRDQLYLALRLATLQERLGNAEGPPLLLDDALKNCDEERSIAALRALGEFSTHAQVIYFTPRAVVAELAKEALGADVDIIKLASTPSYAILAHGA